MIALPCALAGLAATVMTYTAQKQEVALHHAFTHCNSLLTLLPGGRTLHSRCGLPVPLPPPPSRVVSGIKMQHPRAHLLRNMDLLLIDEAPNTSKQVIDAIDQLIGFHHGRS
eukprot:gene56746-biopygen79764